MKTVEEARKELLEARHALKKFNESITLHQVTVMTSGDPFTVESFALRHAQQILLQEIVEAEEELKNAKKAEA